MKWAKKERKPPPSTFLQNRNQNHRKIHTVCTYIFVHSSYGGQSIFLSAEKQRSGPHVMGQPIEIPYSRSQLPDTESQIPDKIDPAKCNWPVEKREPKCTVSQDVELCLNVNIIIFLTFFKLICHSVNWACS